MRDEQEAVEIPTTYGHSYEHPAFGQIAASRTQGGGFALYGSDFRHDATIEVSIRRSQLNREHMRDWHFGKDELVSVRMSEAQWVTFISTPNSGTGVTCTIDHVAGKRMPGIVLRNERDVVEKELDDRLKRVAEHLDAAITGVDEDLAGLSKVKRYRILARMRLAQREVSDSMPFAAKSFSEHVENTIETAKVEIEAYVQAKIVQAGIQALGGTSPLLLGDIRKEQGA